jgi:hypothetical protein
LIHNASIPELTLNENHNAINCHAGLEAVALGIMHVLKEETDILSNQE